MILIAHDIRSLHNVGSVFRSAAAFGVSHLFLTGYTATPPRKEIAKVALGAEQLVPWSAGEVRAVIAECQGNGYRILGLETGGQPLSTVSGSEPVALILGNEVEGIPEDIRALCDGLVSIPMQAKQSLNVSVACGVALYHFACIRSLAG